MNFWLYNNKSLLKIAYKTKKNGNVFDLGCFDKDFRKGFYESERLRHTRGLDYLKSELSLSVSSILWWIRDSIVIWGYVVQKIVDVAEYCI